MDSHRHLISLGFTSEKFPPGTHICYLYSDEDERRRVMSAFLNSGITEREAVHYFPDVLAADMLDHALRQLDLAVPSEEPQQFDIVPAVEAYCPGGHFIPEGMLARLGGLYAQGIAAGFSGARMSGGNELGAARHTRFGALGRIRGAAQYFGTRQSLDDRLPVRHQAVRRHDDLRGAQRPSHDDRPRPDHA